MSLDGFIGKQGLRVRFSNEEDKRRVHAIRAKSDGIMVGISTVLTDNPHLTVRHAKGKNPVRIVVDSNARTPLNAKVLDSSAPTIIAVSRRAPIVRRKRLQEAACVIATGEKKVDLKSLMASLSEMGLKCVLLEGGGTLNRSMLELGLVDEVYLTITPILLGDGIRWINGTLSRKINLAYAGSRRLGDQMVLHYKTK